MTPRRRNLISASLVLALCLAGGGALYYVAQKSTAHDAGRYQLGDQLAAGDAQRTGAPPQGEFREVRWDALQPADFDPMKDFRAARLQRMGDDDPRMQEAMAKLRESWDNAPVVPALDGSKVFLPGFVVPLDGRGGAIREFLLVPYFGACIHTPPPPSNQVIHVVLPAEDKEIRSMSAIWVRGVLRVARSQTGQGVAGYRLEASAVAPYRAP